MYRIDHLAFRTLNKKKAVDFFSQALGYRVQEEFEIYFDDEKKDIAMCTAMEPSNKLSDEELPWTIYLPFGNQTQEYVLKPELFISEGTEGSIVHTWAKNHGGAGLHHVALQVPETSTVEEEMKKWLDMGWTEGFSSDSVMKCDDLSQIFTKPSEVLGVIFELIQRKNHGFCRDSVRNLMLSTKGD